MLQIKDNYVDKNGKFYQIKNYNCEQVSDINEVLGKYITESHYTSENTYEDNGIYLYQHKINPEMGFRIYKDFNLYQYINHDDAGMISKLQEKQPNVALTAFPTAVVTVGNSVIGQEIYYYEDYKPLISIINDLKDPKEELLYYKKIVEIIKELLNNGIYYKDLHCGNFVVKGNSMKLIDFDIGLVTFDKISYNTIIYNLKCLLRKIDGNKILNIDFNQCEKLEDIEEKVKSKILM